MVVASGAVWFAVHAATTLSTIEPALPAPHRAPSGVTPMPFAGSGTASPSATAPAADGADEAPDQDGQQDDLDSTTNRLSPRASRSTAGPRQSTVPTHPVESSVSSTPSASPTPEGSSPPTTSYRWIQATGGDAMASYDSANVAVVQVSPRPGYQATVWRYSPTWVTVRFTNGKHVSTVHCFQDNLGQPQYYVVEEDTGRGRSGTA